MVISPFVQRDIDDTRESIAFEHILKTSCKNGIFAAKAATGPLIFKKEIQKIVHTVHISPGMDYVDNEKV